MFAARPKIMTGGAGFPRPYTTKEVCKFLMVRFSPKRQNEGSSRRSQSIAEGLVGLFSLREVCGSPGVRFPKIAFYNVLQFSFGEFLLFSHTLSGRPGIKKSTFSTESLDF